jgi:ACS family hexuronate transporter-like MFS transporter
MSITVTGLRWWISALLFLATLISYIDRLTLSVLAPLICRDLGLSNLEYAGIGTWFLLTYSFGQTFFGKLQDRIGTRRGLALAMCMVGGRNRACRGASARKSQFRSGGSRVG